MTETNWISLLGSTMNVARSATPSGVEDAGGLGKLALLRSESIGKGEGLELFVLCTPLEVHELVVDGSAENLSVTVCELFVELAECSNLGGAHEGEVLGPEEDDAPLACVVVTGDGGEVVIGCWASTLDRSPPMTAVRL